jgi:acyl-CoA synthetase (NDP forming)
LKEVKGRLPASEINGVLVEEMVNGQEEIIISMTEDQQFGPTIMLGLGGIFVELFKDVSMRVVPISRKDAEEMVKEIKGYQILKGFRRKPELDIKSVIDMLQKISQLAMDFKGIIREIDLNPTILLEKGKGAKAVDYLILLNQ